jgi:hypothetical protein
VVAGLESAVHGVGGVLVGGGGKEGWAGELGWHCSVKTGREVSECLDFVVRWGFVAEGRCCVLCRPCSLGRQACRLCVRLCIGFRLFPL